jgi:hypothetical protein
MPLKILVVSEPVMICAFYITGNSSPFARNFAVAARAEAVEVVPR